MRTQRGNLLGVCSSKGFSRHHLYLAETLRQVQMWKAWQWGKESFRHAEWRWLAWKSSKQATQMQGLLRDWIGGQSWLSLDSSVRNRDKEKGTLADPCGPSPHLLSYLLQKLWLAFPSWLELPLLQRLKVRILSPHTAWPPYIQIFRSPMHAHCCCSVAMSCLTLCNPEGCHTPGFLSLTISQSLLRLMAIESVMPSNHLILCHPPLLLPSIFPNIGVFSNDFNITWIFLFKS